MNWPAFILYPRKVKIIAILPDGLDAKTLIGLPLKNKTGGTIGKIVGVENTDTLVCKVMTKFAKEIDGTAMTFGYKKKA